MIPRIKEQYNKSIIESLKKKLSVNNTYMVPKFVKIVLNMGLGKDGGDKKILQNCIEDMSLITGQKPLVTKFKKSISNFKTRKGAPAGVKVTLRSNKMYEFIDRLVNIALPRIKDFQGLSPYAFDNSFNYTIGIKEHIIFPEINFDKVDRIRGLDIIIVTTANNRESALALLESVNFPFNKSIKAPKDKKKKNKQEFIKDNNLKEEKNGKN
mgnify:FL=1